jgi:hypothetical protein
MMADVVTSVYGGKASVTFSEGKHLYTVDVPEKNIRGLWQPSVTGIIRMMSKAEYLMPWAVGQTIERVKLTLKDVADSLCSKAVFLAVLESARSAHTERKDSAADQGTLVHNYLETELKHRAGLCGPPVLPEDIKDEYFGPVRNAISAGLRFFDNHKVKLVQAEAPRWSAAHGYIGTGDLIAEVDGELSVVDYKTSKRLYSTVFLQLAAYQVAYEEEFPDQKIAKRIAVNVGLDGHLDELPRDNSTLYTDFMCFQSLHTAWRWERENDLFKPKPAPAIVGPLN